MGRFDGILLCTDVDGTLIDSNNKIPQKNIDAVKYFTDCGGMFTLATGRIHDSAREIYHQLGCTLPIISQNGCSIYDMNSEKQLYTTTLEGDVCYILDEFTEEFPETGIEILRDDSLWVARNSPRVKYHMEFEKIRYKEADGYRNVPRPWLRVLFAQEPEITLKMKEFAATRDYFEKYAFVQTHEYYFEIFSKQANKGNALKKLCEMLDVPLENVAAIGDNENDLQMLKLAGRSACVANAAAVVKENCKMVTADNESGGVAEFIYSL